MSCISAVESVLLRVSGVRKVRVGLALGEAEVECEDFICEVSDPFENLAVSLHLGFTS